MEISAFRRIFRAECQKFHSRARLVVEPRHYLARPASRDLAWCDVTERLPTVHVLRRVLSLPRVNIVALIRHELAHLAMPDELDEEQVDLFAEWVCGDPIRYDRAGVQTLGPGGPRPH